MTVFLNIIRWLFALFFSFILFISAVTIIPLLVFTQQVSKKDVGMTMISTFATDTEAVGVVLDALLKAVADSGAIEEPSLQRMFRLAANPTSDIGVAIRNVATPEIVGKNLIENAEKFYTWRDNDALTLDMRLVLANNEADWVQLLTVVMQSRYEELDACTPKQRSEIGRIDAEKLPELPCSVGAISGATFRTAARNMLAEPEIKEIIREGIPLVTYDSSNLAEARAAKDAVLRADRGLRTITTLFWIGLIILVLLMLVLFVPSHGVNFVVTGFVLASTGVAVSAIGRSLVALHEVMKTTLAEPIVQQGMLLAFIGVLSAGFGIWKIVQKNSSNSPVKTV